MEMTKDYWRNYDKVLSNLRYEFKEKDIIQTNPLTKSETGWRDDIDAYRAAESLLDKYIKLDWKGYPQSIVDEYRKLKLKLIGEKKWTLKNTRHYPRTSAEDHIRRLAARINEVEDKVFLSRKLANTEESQRNLIRESAWNWKNYILKLIYYNYY